MTFRNFALCMIGLSVICLGSYLFFKNEQPNKTELEVVKDSFSKNFPKTKSVTINNSPINGLYEVVSSSNIYYTDTNAKYIFVGGIYDPSIQRDITIDRKRVLGILPKENTQEGHVSTDNRPTLPSTVPVSALADIDNYTITLHSGDADAPVIYEIFDPQCGWCNRLYSESKQSGLNITIKALLVPNISDKDMIRDVYCSNEPLKTIDDFARRKYTITGVKADCDITGLNKIYDFYNDQFKNMPLDPVTKIRRLSTPILYDGKTGTLISEGYLEPSVLSEVLSKLHKTQTIKKQ